MSLLAFPPTSDFPSVPAPQQCLPLAELHQKQKQPGKGNGEKAFAGFPLAPPRTESYACLLMELGLYPRMAENVLICFKGESRLKCVLDHISTAAWVKELRKVRSNPEKAARRLLRSFRKERTRRAMEYH